MSRSILFTLFFALPFTSSVNAAAAPAFSGDALAAEFNELTSVARGAKFCTLWTTNYVGYGVCVTGSPSLMQARIQCDTGAFAIALEDPNYHACPPARAINPSLGNASVSGAHRAAWATLDRVARAMKSSPYDVFRADVMQVLTSAGLKLDERSLNRTPMKAADFNATFVR